MRLFPGLCVYHAPDLVSPALSHSIPHPFWVTDNRASFCKAPWENLSCWVPRVDRPLLIDFRFAHCQMEPEFYPRPLKLAVYIFEVS